MPQRIADEPGFYRGKHATAYVEQVQALKRAKQLLLTLVDAVEAEKALRSWVRRRGNYEQLAIVYRGQKNYAAEVTILERCQRQPYRTRVFPFAKRLAKARELAQELNK